MKVFSGVLLRGDGQKIKRGEIEFAQIEFRADDGKIFTWKNVSMSREVSDVLSLNIQTTLYMSPWLGNVYGARTSNGKAAFKSFAANPLALVISIGMIGMGLGTSTLVFPLLVALAGIVGVITYIQAVRAKWRYRRDGKKLGVATHAQLDAHNQG